VTLYLLVISSETSGICVEGCNQFSSEPSQRALNAPVSSVFHITELLLIKLRKKTPCTDVFRNVQAANRLPRLLPRFIHPGPFRSFNFPLGLGSPAGRGAPRRLSRSRHVSLSFPWMSSVLVSLCCEKTEPPAARCRLGIGE
jgi:hypothetical protein